MGTIALLPEFSVTPMIMQRLGVRPRGLSSVREAQHPILKATHAGLALPRLGLRHWLLRFRWRETGLIYCLRQREHQRGFRFNLKLWTLESDAHVPLMEWFPDEPAGEEGGRGSYEVSGPAVGCKLRRD